jgi:hypothetical protein
MHREPSQVNLVRAARLTGPIAVQTDRLAYTGSFNPIRAH